MSDARTTPRKPRRRAKTRRSAHAGTVRESAKAKEAFAELLLLGENATLADLAAHRKSVGETSVKRRSTSGVRQLERWSAQHRWMERREEHFDSARAAEVKRFTKTAVHSSAKAHAALQERADELVRAAIDIAVGKQEAGLPQVMLLRDVLARAGILNMDRQPKVEVDVTHSGAVNHKHQGQVSIQLVRPDNGRLRSA